MTRIEDVIMFCPKCGTKNIEGASFCRACGVDISFVPRAMTGQFPAAEIAKSANDKQGRSSRAKTCAPPDVGKGIERLFLGVGFLFVAVAIWRFMPGGFAWRFWMLIPSFSRIG
ncbi:MAG: zinc-ribbon domain-containing protein [Pyrinomonadaceae bacterium]